MDGSNLWTQEKLVGEHTMRRLPVVIAALVLLCSAGYANVFDLDPGLTDLETAVLKRGPIHLVVTTVRTAGTSSETLSGLGQSPARMSGSKQPITRATEQMQATGTTQHRTIRDQAMLVLTAIPTRATMPITGVLVRRLAAPIIVRTLGSSRTPQAPMARSIRGAMCGNGAIPLYLL